MLFNSATYLLIFLPLLVIGYWSTRGNLRLSLLIIASIIFYGFWRIEFVPLMLGCAAMDYFLAIMIDKQEDQKKRKRLMQVSLAVNLGILGFFKYLVFFRDSLWSFAEMLGMQPTWTELHIILPLGISFYIFQTLSYTIDVYRRDMKPERNILTYLGFVTFWPHLVAGPIMRPDILIPQLRNPPAFDWQKLRKGLERIIFGLFLKVVLADSIAGFVDTGFAQSAATLSGIDSWTLAFLFGFQIFFDFAGYSAIAIGSALLISIHVPENFDWPYVATSPREFWKRWHISLSTWIRDYVYIPLMGTYRGHGQGAWDTMAEAQESTRSPAARTYALFLTWTIMGLWHGANWTFAVWGIYHAAMIFAHRHLSPKLGKTFLGHWFIAWCITLPLMMAGWVPFRAQNLTDSFTMWGQMLMPWRNLSLSLSPNSYIMAAALTLLMMATWVAREVVSPKLNVTGLALNAARTLTFMIAGAVVFVMLQAKTQFIYFQF
jgi:alginate O-acetyltransferase complex protein AlgI